MTFRLTDHARRERIELTIDRDAGSVNVGTDEYITLRMRGLRSSMDTRRDRGDWSDYTARLCMDGFKAIMAEVERQNPERLFSEAIRSQSGLKMYQWGPYIPIRWEDGRALADFSQHVANVDGTDGVTFELDNPSPDVLRSETQPRLRGAGEA